MKNIIINVIVCLALLLITGCKKSEEEVQQRLKSSALVNWIVFMIHLMPFQICLVMGAIVLKKNLILVPS